MLREASSREEPDGLTRQWFTDEYFDLFVWASTDGAIQRFQLCFGKPSDEHALTWNPEGITHHRVDDGEGIPTKNLTPILLPDGIVRWAELERRFLESSDELEAPLRDFVCNRLSETVVPPAEPPPRISARPAPQAGSRQEQASGPRKPKRLLWLALVGGAVAVAALLLLWAEPPELRTSSPPARSLAPIPECQAHETTETISEACVKDVVVRRYLSNVHDTMLAAWQLPPSVEGNQEIPVTIRLDASGRVQCWLFPSTKQGALTVSALSAIGQSHPFPPVPPDARCVTGGAIRLRFRNPSVER